MSRAEPPGQTGRERARALTLELRRRRKHKEAIQDSKTKTLSKRHNDQSLKKSLKKTTKKVNKLKYINAKRKNISTEARPYF